MTDTPPITPDEFVARQALAFAEGMQADQKKKRLFSEMTAITVKDIPWRQRYRIMEVQAAKISGLKTQMSQMKKGYERKIARLNRKIDHLRAGHSESAWQPIETAPKDGKWFLAHGSGDNFEECTFVCYWWEGGASPCFLEALYSHDSPTAPTHWMPLPDPPGAPRPAQSVRSGALIGEK